MHLQGSRWPKLMRNLNQTGLVVLVLMSEVKIKAKEEIEIS